MAVFIEGFDINTRSFMTLHIVVNFSPVMNCQDKNLEASGLMLMHLNFSCFLSAIFQMKRSVAVAPE